MMNDSRIEEMEMCLMACRPDPMSAAMKSRLLDAMQEARLEEQLEQDARRLYPQPLGGALRTRLQESMLAESVVQRRRRLSLRFKYTAAAVLVLCCVAGSLFSRHSGEPHAPQGLQAIVTCHPEPYANSGLPSCSVMQRHTVTIKAEDNTVLRVSIPTVSTPSVPDDVI